METSKKEVFGSRLGEVVRERDMSSSSIWQHPLQIPVRHWSVCWGQTREGVERVWGRERWGVPRSGVMDRFLNGIRCSSLNIIISQQFLTFMNSQFIRIGPWAASAPCASEDQVVGVHTLGADLLATGKCCQRSHKASLQMSTLVWRGLDPAVGRASLGSP